LVHTSALQKGEIVFRKPEKPKPVSRLIDTKEYVKEMPVHHRDSNNASEEVILTT
jgi:hypothetical protein